MSDFKSEINPISQSYHRKLTSPPKNRVTTGGKVNEPTVRELAPITKALMKRRMDAEKIFDVLPDMAYIIATAVSSLTCSKDLVTTSLIYDSDVNLDEVPIEIRDNMLRVVREFFSEEKLLPQKLYRWLYDAMATTGATPVMVISESSFDKMFSLTRESFANEENKKAITDCYINKNRTWGPIEKERSFNVEAFVNSISSSGSNSAVEFDPVSLLSDNDEVEKAMKESYSGSAKLHLTDNLDLCKMPKLKRHLNKESFAESSLGRYFTTYDDSNKEKGAIGAGTVKRAKDLNPDYDATVEKVNLINVPDAKEGGRSNTYALEIVLPAEAVIPVCMPGSEDEPVAYLVMHDSSGNAASVKNIGTLESLIYTSNTTFTDLVNTVSRSLNLDESDVNNVIPKLNDKYAEITERTLIKSLESGRYGEGVSLGKNEDFYRVMAARHMAKRDTYILCVPAEQMAYFAVDKDVNGIGRSIIEKTKVLSTARMVHLFATMRGMINNSSRDLVYTIQLPEEEMDPERAIAQIKFDAINKHNTSAPEWGDPNDIWAQTHNAGLHFKVEGNENYPSTNIDINDNTPDFKLPEKELDDMLVRNICTSALVDPDLVLQPENIEFASQIWSKSLISTKQVIMRQQGINLTLTNYCKMYTYSSGPLLDRLTAAIKESSNFADKEATKEVLGRYVRLFLEKLKVSLTQPDTSFTKSQMEEYTAKMEIIDKILEDAITEDIADEIGLGSDKLRSIIRNWYSLNWLRNNSLEVDLIDIFLDDKDHASIVSEITDRQSVIGGLITRIDNHFNKKMNTAKNTYSGANSKLEGGEEEPFGGDSADDLGDVEDSYTADELGDDADDELEEPMELEDEDEAPEEEEVEE